MSLGEDSDAIDGMTRTLQIIVLALTLGLVSFLAVVLCLPTRAKRPAQGPVVLPVLTVAAFTVAVVVVPLSLVIPRLMVDAARKQIAAGKWTAKLPPGMPPPTTDAAQLAMVYQTQKIVGAALNEGAAFFALLAYVNEGNIIALVLAVLLIVGVALRFPRRDQVAAWIDNQLGQLDADRQAV